MPSLHFKGKAFVQNHHLVVPLHELTPVKAKGTSKTASLHDNLIVEGDNLKALKALLPTYHGKVKCIYIDPPYNTGNEGWAYNDAVNSPMMQDWLGKTVDREDLTRHDKWCCMMLPRLKLLREFLTDDGAIFVSIDDNEVHRLRCLMDEVFGEENFVAEFIWKSRASEDTRALSGVSTDHEYVLCYSRLPGIRLAGVEKDLSKFANPDDDKRGPWRSSDLTGLASKEDRPNLHYDLIDPKTGANYGCPPTGWRYEKVTMQKKIEEKRILWPKDGKGRPRHKLFQEELKSLTKNVSSVILDFTTAEGTRETNEILGVDKFKFPKPSSLVSFIVQQATDDDSIIMDSFAGSGTTAHAVLALNKQDGGNRRFVLIETEDYVDSITAERVRRVAKGVPGAKDETLKAGLGGTFSYFKLGRPMQMSAILDGSTLPDFESLARYVFFTATGEEFDAKKLNRKTGFIGTSRLHDVFLLYTEDAEKLKQLALTLDAARALPSVSGKPKLVFAPTKYLDESFLDRLRITFCQLPFQIYKALDV